MLQYPQEYHEEGDFSCRVIKTHLTETVITHLALIGWWQSTDFCDLYID
jgi:hypothetical protein